MRFQILTIFPDFFERFRKLGLVGRACEEGTVSIETRQLRDFAINTHGQIDDSPYGGGSGMVLRLETAVAAIKAAKEKDPDARVILFTPRGRKLDQPLVRHFVEDAEERKSGFILLCCRYEGVDERIAQHWVDDEISIGDYIIQGGESAAAVFIEATTRLLPGVLGNPESTVEESFESALLEYPQYTKPSEYEGFKVPEVLLSGNHKRIAEWRKKQAYEDTVKRRPDLAGRKEMPRCEISVALVHYPVLNKNGEVVASSITNLDLHDIARSACTYGIEKYYVIHPTKTLRRLSEKICEHWETGYGLTYNANRGEALSAISIVPDLEDAITDIEVRTGKLPKIVTTSAKDDPPGIEFEKLREILYGSEDPHLILFGTGWGLTQEVLDRTDYHLKPVKGFTDYNHLSVRGAAAIIFDRLFGAR